MYRQKVYGKDLEITPKTKGRFCSYNQNYQFVKILKGVLTDGPNVQNFEKGSENYSPVRASWKCASLSALKKQTLGGSDGLLLLLLHDARKLHF